MVDTSLQYFEALLADRWQPTYDGPAGTRSNDVPQPTIAIATDKAAKRLDPRREDLLFVRAGGAQQLTPRSVGWTEQRTETLVTLDCRTTQSRQRLEGTRNGANEKEAYGGLRGEVKRILDTVRTGDKEFDWVNGYEYRPLSEDMGFGNWRGAWEVRLTELAEDIQP
jgi:hypothetical protein